jgi:hypothetical protein
MKIQKEYFEHGFALHKVRSPKFTGHCSAWYFLDGKMVDARWTRRDGQERLIPIGTPMWRYLESFGLDLK